MTRPALMIIAVVLVTVIWGPAFATSTATLDSLQAMIAAGQYERAVTESEVVLARWEREYGADSLEAAQAMDMVARSHNSAGRAAEPRTMELIERAIAIKSELLGAEHLETIASQYWRAQILSSLGRSDEAIAELQHVLAIRTRELGPEHELLGDVHGSLGIALATSGRLQESRIHFERTVAILEAAVGPDAPEVGGGYTNLATLYHMLGDLPAAAGAIRKAIANIEHNYGADHPSLVPALYTLSNIHMGRGEVRAAVAQLERAQEILAANDMSEHPRAASIWNGLGLAARSLGDYTRAQECLERGLRIYEKAYGPDHIQLSYYLNNIGLVAQQTGDDERAGEALARAVRLTSEQLGADHLRTVSSEYYLAVFELQQGKLDVAATRFERCLEKLSADLGEQHSLVAEVCGDLALLKEKKHLLGEAGALLDRALATTGGVTNPATMAGLRNTRARVHLRQQDYVASCDEALQVESAAAEQYRVIVQTLSEGASRRFAATRTNGLSVALSALLAQEASTRPVAEVWDRVIRSRGLLLDELAARRRLVTASVEPESQRLAADVFAARSRLADMYVRGAADRTPERYAAALQSARDDKARAEAALATHSAAFRATAADRTLGLADIRRALPAGSALVAWQRFQRIASEDEEAWYCAFVLANDEVSMVDLGPAAVVDDLIDQWRSGLLEVWAPGGALAEAGIAANRELGARLRDLVWTPCADKVAGVETVFAVPDGDLHLLPLAALPDPAGGYLLEQGPTFHYLSREKSLVRAAVTAGSGLLALGDPAFDGRVEQTLVAAVTPSDFPGLDGVFRGAAPDCERLQTMRFGALPSTRQECEQVSALAGPETQLLLGAAATEAAFKAELGGQRIVHLATHGYFLGSDCPAAGAGYADDPLLLSGLALAGANLRGEARAGQEDGILTAEEISLLDLRGVEWVVLSACDTGLGVLQPGEGVYGMQRAFETAGAGTVIMSLWPVEDQVTRQWMSGLYAARLGEGRATPAAVRQAALDVLRQRRTEGLSEHPFWWAGFVASGDWR